LPRDRRFSSFREIRIVMKAATAAAATRLEEIPNVGPRMAADLRSLGVRTPCELAARRPLELYLQLETAQGGRHDPCVFYTLLAAAHFLETSEPLPWWRFTAEGKRILAGLEK
jgi:DNA transformation protein